MSRISPLLDKQSDKYIKEEEAKEVEDWEFEWQGIELQYVDGFPPPAPQLGQKGAWI